ncbi:hypothetical protein Moror_7334 [Moniliophthora roreri MCA 2997]|uniref:Membrane anchor Opy2 N-terminal domain-containing protein n=1 Tax=Moniliophthora roreri (strain MCA 2997) TaxID=1381753 RepID=V2YWB6_MONRO|nr:hypothetical protein Moror_7334 [Moniliophthora roreri MCA 2997]
MILDNLLFRRDDCVVCVSIKHCFSWDIQSSNSIDSHRDCQTCYEIRCDPPSNSSSSSSSGGPSKGALAGAIVGVLIFLGLAVGLFMWYRRGSRFRRTAPTAPEAKPDIPASAEDVLKRPDPTEKPPSPVATELNTVRVYSTSSNTTIDLDPESQASSHHTTPGTASRHSVRSNPFSDTHSIQTAVTEGTNVIPIALVSPESSSLRSNDESTSSTSPVRPARTPDMDLNLDHVNVSHGSLRTPANYALSQRSGVSGVSSRNSYMSSASYSSDFLNEAPMIVTANKGPVRQVLGVRKAEMINAGSLTPTSAEGLKVQMARPTVGSPLAATSFGPSDLASVSDKASEDGVNPFSDKHASTRTTLAPSSAGAASTTFGQSAENSPHTSIQSNWMPDGPHLPWAKGSDSDTRPSSISTQAGSVIDIASATRVNVGLGHLSPLTSAGTPKSPYRTTMGRLVSPPTGGSTFEEQQAKALSQAQARRISGSSVVSSTSTRADSILESFPFVPPSPISNRPVRSPPVSPLGKQSFSSGPSSPATQQGFQVTPPSPSPASTPQTPLPTTPLPTTPLHQTLDKDGELPAPPNRRMLGLSTGSQMSTASSGLGSFPFQIDSGDSTNVSSAPSSFNNGGRQRASLDTLAITSDLSSYPLGFDRDSNVPPLPR